MTLPVSVQIIALNEEEQIADCLDSVLRTNPAEIIVIDGGSEDRTVQIADSRGVRVLTPGRLGRGASRILGYESTSHSYVAMVDADDRVEPDWLQTSLDELRAGHYAALQSSLRTVARRNFWERGWDEYFIESIKPSSDVVMVGHPAVYERGALLAARRDVGNDHEDTQLSIDFQDKGFRQGIGTATSRRVVPLNASENIRKWVAYGRGYRDLVTKHPDRRSAIERHMFVTIPIRRGWSPVRRGNFLQPLFCFIMTGAIVTGYYTKRNSDG